MPVRLKDIARDLGVSVVTVSKVLRGNSDIGEATRERVLSRMRELNYQPNMLARGLASGKSFTVGLVVPDLIHPFFAEFARALSGALRTSQRALILASSDEDPETERQEIRTLLSRGVDTLILASCQPRLASADFGSTPTLLFDRNFRDGAAPPPSFLGSDDLAVGQLATQHLIEIGRRRIAHIGGQHWSTSLDRLQGYRNALTAAGLPIESSLILTRPRVEESGDRAGFEAMQQLLALPQPPDAVFCYNDLTAVGAIEATLAAGLRVPQDVAVIGCGNLRYAPYLRVPLSSIDHNTTELGRLAADLTLRLAEAPGPQTILLPPTLVARASTLAV